MVLDRDLMGEDEPCPDTFSRLRVMVLDGNHRVRALRELFGEEHRVTCNVYWAFDPEISRVISDSECTGSNEAVVWRWRCEPSGRACPCQRDDIRCARHRDVQVTALTW